MDLVSLQNQLKDLPIGPIRFFDTIGSTNEEALQWADHGAPDLSIVFADEQTNGRGRQGRKWFTPAGSAIACSILLKDIASNKLSESVPAQSFLLPRLTALGTIAVCDALRNQYQLEPRIKWPNDVLLQDKKVAGVLTEIQWQGEVCSSVVIGIGVNVYPGSIPPQDEIISPATCVQDKLRIKISRLDLIKSILGKFLQYYPQLFEPTFSAYWNDYLAYKGEWVNLYIPNASQINQRMNVKIIGVTAEGNLKVLTSSGTEKSLINGEISFKQK